MSETIEQKKEFLPIPSGEYVGILKEACLEKMKNGNGKRMAMRFEVESDDEKRVVFHNLTVAHVSPKAVAGGKRGAELFLKAVGVEEGLDGVGQDMTAVMDYVNKPLIIVVGQEPPRDYVDAEGNEKRSKARNKVITFKSV